MYRQIESLVRLLTCQREDASFATPFLVLLLLIILPGVVWPELVSAQAGRPARRPVPARQTAGQRITEQDPPAPTQPLLRQTEPRGWVWVTQTVDITRQLGGEQNMMTLDGEPLPSMLRKRVTLGLILDDEGHIATRLIDVTPQSAQTAATTVTVRSVETKPVAAKFLGMDLVSGLCILKVEGAALKPAAFYTPRPLPLRLDIRLYGFNPNQRMSPNASTIYSSPRRNIYAGRVSMAVKDFRYQTSNPLYYLTSPRLTAAQDGSLILGPGNEIFGMAIYDSGGQGQHLVYPMSRILTIARTIISSRESLRYGWFGATGMDVRVGPPSRTFSQSVENLGVRIIAVAPDSPADRAGVEPKDILLSVNDQRVTSYAQLATIIRQLPPDSEITVRVRRGQETKILRSRLVPAPSIEPEQQLLAFARQLETMEKEWRALPTTDPRRPALGTRIEKMRNFVGAITAPAPPEIRLRVFYGIEIIPLTSQLMRHFAVDHGLLVSSTFEKREGATTELRAGDIILRVGEQRVNDLAGLLEALEKMKSGLVNITIMRNRQELVIGVERGRAQG